MERPSPLQRLALFARRRSPVVLAVLGILVLIAALLALRLQVETDPLRLLVPGAAGPDAGAGALAGAGRDVRLLVAIRIPERAAPAPYERLAEELAARLDSLPEIARVEHRAGSPEELAAALFPKGVLLLDERGRRRLVARLSDEEIWRRVGELRRLLAGPENPENPEIAEAARLALRDPLGLAAIFVARLEGELDLDWTWGDHLSRDRRLLLLLAQPSRPATDLRFDRRLAAEVYDAVASSLAGWGALPGAGGLPAPKVMVGGAPIAALDGAGLVARDLLLSLSIAAAIAFLALLFAFRRPEPLLYALAPIACALLLAAGFAGVAVGAISAATAWVPALLVGVATGFAILYYGRYLEERRHGAGPEEALLAAAGAGGRAVVAGAVLGAAGFYALALSGIPVLHQLGLLAGTGVLLCAAAVLLLLPGLIAWTEERRERANRKQSRDRPESEPGGGPDDRRVEVEAEAGALDHRDDARDHFGPQGLPGLAVRRTRLVLLGGLAIVLAAFALAFRVPFEPSLEVMRPQGSRADETAREVDRHFGPGTDRLALVVSGGTPEEALALAGRAAEGAERLRRRGVLRGYGGISSLIPPPAAQAEALSWLARERGNGPPDAPGATAGGVGAPLDMARIRASFAKALNVHGLPQKPFEPGLDLLARALSIDRPIGPADFPASAAGGSLPDRYLEPAADGWRTNLHLDVAGDRGRGGPPPEVVALARELGPGVRLAGTSLVEERLRAQVPREAWQAGLLALALVAVLLWLDLRNLRATLLALVPPLFGIAAMLGGLALLGVSLNVFSAFLPAILLGLGAGYGAQALRGDRAVMAAALAATAALGSIVFSHHPALRGAGAAAIVGMLATGLAAVALTDPPPSS